MEKQKKGFAVMNKEQAKAIASLGGKAVSSDREHMRVIGAAGGKRSAEVKAFKRENNLI